MLGYENLRLYKFEVIKNQLRAEIFFSKNRFIYFHLYLVNRRLHPRLVLMKYKSNAYLLYDDGCCDDGV